ncbi:MAG: hypothetical protein ACR2FY_02700 [Pirellulaceae bacterium]
MSQSLSQIYLHVVYSTKHRKPFLKDDNLLAAFHAYSATTLANLDCPALIVGGHWWQKGIECPFPNTPETA